MDSLRFGLALLGLLMATLATSAPAPENLRLMTWNIWHGGRENDRFRGPRQVMDVIRQSQADVVMMQETYGSGELIARGLDFHFQPRGTNVSLHSRYPIEEDLSVGEPFNCVGALVCLPSGRRVAVYSLWLPYGEDIWIPATRRASSLEAMLAACQPSAEVLERLLDQIHQRLAGPQYADVPVVIGGDFNSMS
ncbi:MAG: endonuclease/exonuclease/phosphatase family protein, partial [Fimbriimonadaceae bacterium]